MKYLGKIQDDKDLVTKEYVDGKAVSIATSGNNSNTYNITIGGTTYGVAKNNSTNSNLWVLASEKGANSGVATLGTDGKLTSTQAPTNNVTGSGTSGYLTKFNGANTITNGPQLGSDTTKYLRNDGTWDVPPGTGGVTVDSALSTTSTNPVQNGVITTKFNNIGTIVEPTTVTTSVALTAGTSKKVHQISLTAGTWVIRGRIRFASNSSSYRRGNITSTSADDAIHVQVMATNGGVTSIEITNIVSISSTTTYYLNAMSGVALNVTRADLKAVRII